MRQGTLDLVEKPAAMPVPGPSCGETAGFLFSHPCKNAAIQPCSTCAKPICAAHARRVAGHLICVSCSRQQPAYERWDDPYDYPTLWYSDYREYDRWDRYRRRSTPEIGATSSFEATPDDSFGDAGPAPGVSADGFSETGDSFGAADGLGGTLPDEGAGLGGALPTEGAGLGGSLGDDDGWESDFDAS